MSLCNVYVFVRRVEPHSESTTWVRERANRQKQGILSSIEVQARGQEREESCKRAQRILIARERHSLTKGRGRGSDDAFGGGS